MTSLHVGVFKTAVWGHEEQLRRDEINFWSKFQTVMPRCHLGCFIVADRRELQ